MSSGCFASNRRKLRSNRAQTALHPPDRQGLHTSLSSPKLKHINVSMSSPTGPGLRRTSLPERRLRIGPNACKSVSFCPLPEPADHPVKPEDLGVNPSAWRRRNETIARFLKRVQTFLKNSLHSPMKRCPGHPGCLSANPAGCNRPGLTNPRSACPHQGHRHPALRPR